MFVYIYHENFMSVWYYNKCGNQKSSSHEKNHHPQFPDPLWNQHFCK